MHLSKSDVAGPLEWFNSEFMFNFHIIVVLYFILPKLVSAIATAAIGIIILNNIYLDLPMLF